MSYSVPLDDYPLPPQEFGTRWDDITKSVADELERIVETATSEGQLQRFLESHPNLLVQHLGGGHGRWVVPQKRLGSEFVPDFIVGSLDSIGYHWELVELESPRQRMFIKSGDYSAATNHGIAQIKRWRSWLLANGAYARAGRADHGLGLTGIRPNAHGIVLIGRRGIGSESVGLRTDDLENARIAVHSYDWLLERARARIRSLRGPGPRTIVENKGDHLLLRQVYLNEDGSIRPLTRKEADERKSGSVVPISRPRRKAVHPKSRQS